jgi:hypothetical protein
MRQQNEAVRNHCYDLTCNSHRDRDRNSDRDRMYRRDRNKQEE